MKLLGIFLIIISAPIILPTQKQTDCLVQLDEYAQDWKYDSINNAFHYGTRNQEVSAGFPDCMNLVKMNEVILIFGNPNESTDTTLTYHMISNCDSIKAKSKMGYDCQFLVFYFNKDHLFLRTGNTTAFKSH